MISVLKCDMNTLYIDESCEISV